MTPEGPLIFSEVSRIFPTERTAKDSSCVLNAFILLSIGLARAIALYENIRQEIARNWRLLCTAISPSSPYGVFARVVVSKQLWWCGWSGAPPINQVLLYLSAKKSASNQCLF